MSVLIDHVGPGLLLLFGTALCFLVVGSERIITLFFRLSHDTERAIEAVREAILSKKYTEAIQLCNSSAQAVDLSVVKSALLAVENGREAMKSAIGAALLEVSHKCERRLPYVALIANVATLLGLLGTITGLIKTFSALANADAAEKARMLGMGISEAMYSTASGLGLGIAAMVVHTLCISKSDAIVGHAQDVGYKVITWVEQSERVKRNG